MKHYDTPYQQNMPIQQKTHRNLSMGAVDFLKDLCSSGKYRENFSIWVRKSGDFKKVASLSTESLVSFAEKMHVSPELDYYIAKNPSKNGKRTLESMCSLENIVIDIDCHQRNIDSHLLRPSLDEAIWLLRADLFENGIVPEPSYIVYTGRGIQLWWMLEANIVTDCYMGKMDKVKENWLNHIMASLTAYHGDYPLTVDRAASMNDVGLVRLPGSTNTKTGAVVTIEHIYSGRYNLHREYDNRVPLPGELQKVRYSPTNGIDLIALSNYRINMIERLRSLRNAPAGQETRNDMNFLVYCAAQMANSPEVALEITEEFNRGFKEPMSSKELKNVICAARRKPGGYKFRSTTFLAKLAVTAEEATALGIGCGAKRAKNAARDERRTLRKQRRNSEIIRAYTTYGNIQSAANAVGCDPRTAAKVIHSHLENLAEKKRMEEKKRAAWAAKKQTAWAKWHTLVEAICITKEKLAKLLSAKAESDCDADLNEAAQSGLLFRDRKNGRLRMYLVKPDGQEPAYVPE